MVMQIDLHAADIDEAVARPLFSHPGDRGWLAVEEQAVPSASMVHGHGRISASEEIGRPLSACAIVISSAGGR
jgi:hypothetical protein